MSASGASNYSWDYGVTDGVAFVPTLGTTIYTVSFTNPNGCVSTDQVTVTVNPQPTIDIIPDTTICSGETIDLYADTVGMLVEQIRFIRMGIKGLVVSLYYSGKSRTQIFAARAR